MTRDLTPEDKRSLQTALAFAGTYRGLLDGTSGSRGQSAFEQYFANEFGTRSEDWHMALLAYDFFNLYEKDDWNIQYLPALGLSVMVPGKSLITDAPSDNFLNYRHSRSPLSIPFGTLSTRAARRVHEYTLGKRAANAAPYTVRKDNFAVTSMSLPDGSTIYTRSNYTSGAWSTIILSASRSDANILNAVSTGDMPQNVNFAVRVNSPSSPLARMASSPGAAMMPNRSRQRISPKRQKRSQRLSSATDRARTSQSMDQPQNGSGVFLDT